VRGQLDIAAAFHHFHNFGSAGKSSPDYLPHPLVGLGDGSLVSMHQKFTLKTEDVFPSVLRQHRWYGVTLMGSARYSLSEAGLVFYFGTRDGYSTRPVLVKVNDRL